MAKIIKNQKTGEYCHFSQRGNAFAIRAARNGQLVEIERVQNDPQACLDVWNRYDLYSKHAPRINVTSNPQGMVAYLNDLNTQNSGHSLSAKGPIIPKVELIKKPTNDPPPSGPIKSTPPTGRVLTPEYDPDNDPFWDSATKWVEQSIDELVEEFIEKPYLHRVEHSLHTQFVLHLKKHPELAKEYPIGSTKQMTQLVHKEWPETTPRPGNKPRGKFDIAVLSPELLKSCPSLEDFNKGRLSSQVVIEFGLNYEFYHLSDDKDKLRNSNPKHGYLVHFVRDKGREPQVEKLVCANDSPRIKTAYVCHTYNKIYYKKVNDTVIKIM